MHVFFISHKVSCWISFNSLQFKSFLTNRLKIEGNYLLVLEIGKRKFSSYIRNTISKISLNIHINIKIELSCDFDNKNTKDFECSFKRIYKD